MFLCRPCGGASGAEERSRGEEERGGAGGGGSLKRAGSSPGKAARAGCRPRLRTRSRTRPRPRPLTRPRPRLSCFRASSGLVWNNAAGRRPGPARRGSLDRGSVTESNMAARSEPRVQSEVKVLSHCVVCFGPGLSVGGGLMIQTEAEIFSKDTNCSDVLPARK